jgi:hypothetical protein
VSGSGKRYKLPRDRGRRCGEKNHELNLQYIPEGS